MYGLLALLTGLVLSVMVSVNGILSGSYGVFRASVIIHVVGILFAYLLCAVRKENRKLTGHAPAWIYLGGAIGAFTTVFNNLAFGHISMTSIVALGLLGQALMSLVIDCLGLFGMKRCPFCRYNLVGLAFSLTGIFVMLDATVGKAAYAVLLSLAAGVTVVLSRTVNARLSGKVGALSGSLVNHMAGLPVTVVICLLAGETMKPVSGSGLAAHPFIYTGGMMGVIVVMLCNLTVPRLPAFRLTMLTFVGQIFTGVLLDVAAGKGRVDASFAGGLMIAAGIAVNMGLERMDAAGKKLN